MDTQNQRLGPALLQFVKDINLAEIPENSLLGSKQQVDSWQSSDHRGSSWRRNAGPGVPAAQHRSERSVPSAPDNYNRGTHGHSKTKRRRTITVVQRKAANVRERKRMFGLNEAFDELRRKVPTFAYEKRLSRIETLRLAIVYISFMKDLLENTCATFKTRLL